MNRKMVGRENQMRWNCERPYGAGKGVKKRVERNRRGRGTGKLEVEIVPVGGGGLKWGLKAREVVGGGA